MSSTTSDRKELLRQRCNAIRAGLGDEIRQQANQAICTHLSIWDIFLSSETILTYMPIRDEVDLRPLLINFSEKRWLLPRIVLGKKGRMVFHPYEPKSLIRHSFGMAEPAPYLPQVPPTEIQLVLAPGLAFDRSGWRLGYGGGYFDRFLKDFSGVSVGVSYRALLLKALPHSKYDIPVNWLVTENGLLRVGRN